MKTFIVIAIIVLLVIAGTLFFSRNVAGGVEYRYDMDGNLIEVIK